MQILGKSSTIQKGRVSAFVLFVVVLMGVGLYSAYYLNRIYREKELEIQRLNEVVERLGAETRMAQVVVKDQSVDPKTGTLETTIKFMEIGRNGEPLPPRDFTVEGDVIYFDALVIKFNRDYIERGEALRGKNICLFRRIFGEHQSPEDGFLVDNSRPEKKVPDIYRVDSEPSAFEVDLWTDFWRYAENPKEAQRRGVRVIQGEAVYTRFLPQNLYTLTLEHSGGINIRVEPIPPILLDEMDKVDP
jgi:hypothetical protein